MMWLAVFVFYQIISVLGKKTVELWEEDVTSQMKIGFADPEKYQVDLKCGAEAFLVNVTVGSDFDGVLYTRGDFRMKQKPCYQIHKDFKNRTDNFLMYYFRIPFTRCHTIMDASQEQYKNILVVQNDRELITPGDAAFQLACAFSPEHRLGATILTKSQSEISLLDADPANTQINESYQVFSDSDTVSFPKRAYTAKDEL